MQRVTLSGTLVTDVFRQLDKNGRQYIRFTLACGTLNTNQRMEYTYYKCVSYIRGYDELKKGDQLFLTGKLQATIGYNEDRSPMLNLLVSVTEMTGGQKEEDKKKK